MRHANSRLNLMRLDTSHIDTVAFAIGATPWVAVIVAIWFSNFGDGWKHSESDFEKWKIKTGRPLATFADFIGSEDVPRIYLTKAEATVLVAVAGALGIFWVFVKWHVLLHA